MKNKMKILGNLLLLSLNSLGTISWIILYTRGNSWAPLFIFICGLATLIAGVNLYKNFKQ